MVKSFYYLCFLVLFITNLNATTYYVANSGGNDANSGTSSASAWKTISKVNSTTFSSGDIISFKCGDRFSDATLIPPTNYLTFNSYGTGSRPVIDGQSSRICVDMLRYTRNNITFTGLKFVNGFHNDIVMWNCNNITFESCNIDSSRGGTITYSNIYAGQGNNLIVRNSTISYGAQSTTFDGNLGIYLDGTDNCLMEYDTLIGSFSNLRVAFGTSDLGMANGLIVRYCVLKNGRYDNVDDDGSAGAQFYYNVFDATNINIYLFTDGSGSYDAYAARNSSYYNNTFFTHGSEASIHLNSRTGVNNGMVLKNNIFYSDNSSGYYFYEEVSGQMGTWTFTNNLYYMTSSNSHGWVRHGVTYSSLAQWQSIGYDANSIYADPLFNNYAAKDYSLQTGSKAINSGVFVGLTIDMVGNAVPTNYPDMGAYQHFTNLGGGGGTLPVTTLNLTALIEALYAAGGTQMTTAPWVTVELHNATAPYALVDSNTARLSTSGTGTFTFTKAANNTNYFIAVKSINTIETWSATPQVFTSSVLNYNFTTAVTQAYTDGSNPPLSLQNGKYCLYSADLNHDGLVNGSDYSIVDNDNCAFSYHLSNDLNGDGFVSSADDQFIDNNSIHLIHRQVPAGAPGISIIGGKLQANLNLPESSLQNPTFNLTLANAKQGSNKTFEVDVYLQSTSTSPIELASISMGISYNSAVKSKGGTLTASWVQSSSQLTNQTQLPSAMNTATTGVIKIAGKIPPGPGNGSIISNVAPGTKIGRLRITISSKFTGGQAINFAWLPSTQYPTTINAYVASLNTNITVSGSFNNAISGPIVNLGLPTLATSIQDNRIVLNISTETELDAGTIEIQRAEVIDQTTEKIWNTIKLLSTAEINNPTKLYSFTDNKVQPGKYQYRIKVTGNDGEISLGDEVETSLVVLPKDFSMSQNYPNPFNPTTKINYQVPTDAKVIVEVYNIAGQKVAELVNRDQSAGYYSVDFGSTNNLSSGVYIYRMTAIDKATGNNFSAIKKMMLLK